MNKLQSALGVAERRSWSRKHCRLHLRAHKPRKVSGSFGSSSSDYLPFATLRQSRPDGSAQGQEVSVAAQGGSDRGTRPWDTVGCLAPGRLGPNFPSLLGRAIGDSPTTGLGAETKQELILSGFDVDGAEEAERMPTPCSLPGSVVSAPSVGLQQREQWADDTGQELTFRVRPRQHADA